MMMPRRQSARDASAAIMANCEPAVALTNATFAIRQDLQARFAREGLQWLAVDLEPAPVATRHVRSAAARSAGYRLSAIHLGLDLRSQRRRGQPRQPARQPGNDPPVARQHQPIDLRQLGAALSRHGTDPEHAAGALCRRALRADGAERLHPAAAGLAARHSATIAPKSPAARISATTSASAAIAPSRCRASTCPAGRSRSTAPSRFMPKRSSGSSRPSPATASMPMLHYPAYGMAEATLLISGGRRGAGHVTRTVSRVRAASPHGRRTGRATDDVHTLVGCGRALVNERIAIVDPDGCTRLPPDQVGEIWVNGAERRARLLEKSGRDADRPERANRRRRRRRELAAHRRSRLPRCDRANCSSPAGSRTSSSSAASITIRRTSSAPCRQRIRRCAPIAARPSPCRRARRGSAGHRPGDRAHRAQPDRSGRNEGTDPRERDRPARAVRAAYRADPAGYACPRPPAARSSAVWRASSGSNGSSRILRQARTDQKSILAASPSLMLAAIPSRHPGRQDRAIVDEVGEVRAIAGQRVVDAIIDEIAVRPAGHDPPQGRSCRPPAPPPRPCRVAPPRG